jgi:hypothetical protein
LDRSAHRRAGLVRTDVPKVKAAQARLQVAAITSDKAPRLICHDAHCRRENRGVAALSLCAPSLKTGGENAGEIRLRGTRQTEARHVRSARAFASARQAPDVILEIGVLELDEIAALECVDAGLDFRP